MHGSPLIAWLLVLLSACAAAACLLRSEGRDEALMGAGMAVMAVPLSVFDPRPWATAVFAAVFAVAALRALLVTDRSGHRLHHCVSSAAMVYMALAMGGGSGGGGHAAMTMGAGIPLLTGLLLLYFAGYVLRSGVRLVAVPLTAGPQAPASHAPVPQGSGPLIPGGAPRPRLRHAPELAAACRVSMALGMLAMLLTL